MVRHVKKCGSPVILNFTWLDDFCISSGDSGRDHQQFGIELHVYDLLRCRHLGD
jgi:hypothetical protein